jgi:hypothetical protein
MLGSQRQRRYVQPLGLQQVQTGSMVMLIWQRISTISRPITGGMSNYQNVNVYTTMRVLTGTTRNFGIMLALMIFGCFVHLVAIEYVSAKKSKGEVLLFRRGYVPQLEQKLDEESNSDSRINTAIVALDKYVVDVPASIQKHTATFHWDSVTYDIKVKNSTRRLLDDIDGWINPGTLTALMVCRISQS